MTASEGGKTEGTPAALDAGAAELPDTPETRASETEPKVPEVPTAHIAGASQPYSRPAEL